MPVVRNMMVRAGADFSAITKQAAKAKASVADMGSGINRTCAGVNKAISGVKAGLAVLGVAASIQGLVADARKARDAYREVATARAKLAQVMHNTMGAEAAQVKEIEALISVQEKLGVVSGGVQTAGAQELATYLSETASLKKLIPVMNDMVTQQYGLNASEEQAANIGTMLGKVMQGQVGALSRYGYYFDSAQEAVLKYGTEAQRAAVLAQVVEDSVGGMNAALAATPEGRLKQVNITLGSIQENFGKAVSTALTAFIPALNTVCNILASAATLANKVAQAIANVFGGGSSVGAKAVTYSAGTADALEDAEAAAQGTAGGLNSAVAAAKKLQTFSFDTLNKFAADKESSGGGVTSGGGAGTISEAMEAVSDAGESVGWLERALQRVKSAVEQIDMGPLRESATRLKESLKGIADVVGSYLEPVWDHVLVPLGKWLIEDIAPASVDALAASLDALAAVLRAVQPAFEWLLKNVVEPLAAWLKTLEVRRLDDLRVSMEHLAAAIDTLFNGEGGLSTLPKRWSDFWDEIFQGFDPLVNGFRRDMNEMGAGGVAGFFEGLASGNWDLTLRSLFQVGVVQFVKNLLGIHSPSTVFKGIGENTAQGFLNGLRAKWTEVTTWLGQQLNTITQRATTALSNIRQAVTVNSGAIYSGGLGTGAYRVKAGATGMVLPPNQPHLAIVGDQHSGMNVETPLGVMTDAMLAALRISNYSGGNSEQTDLLRSLLVAVKAGKIIEIDSEVLGRTMRRQDAATVRAYGL